MLVKGPLVTTPQNRQISNTSRTLVCNKIVHRSYLVGACSNFIFILDLAPRFNGLGHTNWRDKKHLGFGVWCVLYYRFDGNAYVVVLASYSSTNHVSATCRARGKLTRLSVRFRFSVFVDEEERICRRGRKKQVGYSSPSCKYIVYNFTLL